MRRRRFVATAGAVLAGCSEGTWLGPKEAPPLEGKRVPVLLIGEGATADPRLANLTVVLPPPVLNADWPQYGGEPSNVMHHLAAADAPQIAWRVGIGRGAAGSARLLGRPVVAGGRVFAVDGGASVVALDAGTGSRAWSFQPDDVKLDDRIAGGAAAIDAGVVYATLAPGEVVALSAGSGDLVWRIQLRAPLRSAPTIAGGLVLVRTADNQTVALDAGTGQFRWRHAGLDEPTAVLGGAPPAVQGQVAVVAYSSGEVVALALATGRPIWSETVGQARRTLAAGTILDIAGAPVIDRDRVVVAGNAGEIAALDLRRGDRLWSAPLSSRGTPWVAGEFLYIVTDRGELVCLLRQGGRVRWVSPLNELAGSAADGPAQVWTGPILVGDRLLLGGSSGEMLSASPYTGEITGRVRIGGRISQSPTVAGSTIYALTDAAELVAFR